MTVYVDNARIPWRGWRMSHMYADTPSELHALADRIGLKRSWFQDTGHGLPHYDLTDGKRAQALAAGAVFAEPGDGTYRAIRRRHAAGEWTDEYLAGSTGA